MTSFTTRPIESIAPNDPSSLLFQTVHDPSLQYMKVVTCGGDYAGLYGAKNLFFIHPVFNGSKQQQWPTKTELHCKHCEHEFDTFPVPLPLSFDQLRNAYTCDCMVFCSFECAKGYMNDHPRPTNPFSLIYLNQIRHAIIGPGAPDFVSPAPKPVVLKKYGGPYDIATYRSLFCNPVKVNPDTRMCIPEATPWIARVHDKPLFFANPLAVELVENKEGRIPTLSIGGVQATAASMAAGWCVKNLSAPASVAPKPRPTLPAPPPKILSMLLTAPEPTPAASGNTPSSPRPQPKLKAHKRGHASTTSITTSATTTSVTITAAQPPMPPPVQPLPPVEVDPLTIGDEDEDMTLTQDTVDVAMNNNTTTITTTPTTTPTATITDTPAIHPTPRSRKTGPRKKVKTDPLLTDPPTTHVDVLPVPPVSNPPPTRTLAAFFKQKP